jgi:CDP-6-deoxy-D-xylo-4-hexulose-3-dehydrase
MTDLQAALGVAQLARLDEFIAVRQHNFAHLKARLQACEEFLILPEATPGSDPSWFGFLLTLRENAPCDRVDLLRFLDQHKIGTRLLFAGNVTRQPYLQGRRFRISGDLATANVITERSFWIGVYPGLSTEMLDYAADKIGEFLGVGF